MIVAAFVISLAVFTAIGVASSLKSRGDAEDYLVAGRSVPPWLVALSAVATMNSGFMFVGQIGFTYRVGLHSVWMLVGWTVGDYLAWKFFYQRLRRLSARERAASPLSLLLPDGVRGERALTVAAGVIAIVFLAAYAAAQLKAGGTALETLFGWPAWAGAALGAVMVAVYCFSGGIRASIWSDAAQSVVMIFSMLLLTGVALSTLPGERGLMEILAARNPALTHWFPRTLRFGFPLYLLGMVFGGFGVIGAPHILVRSMTLDDSAHVAKARRIYFAWLIPFYAAAILLGLCARAWLPELAQPTPEMAGLDAAALKQAIQLNTERAMPALALRLLPPAFVGLMLAGLFGATMSTADSLIIACTSAATQDVAPRWRRSLAASKAVTLAVTLLALAIALSAGKGVFQLVLFAWSAPAATIGPLMILRLLGRPVEGGVAAMMMLAGLSTAVYWDLSGLSGQLYTILPAMAAAFTPYVLSLGARRLVERTVEV